MNCVSKRGVAMCESVIKQIKGIIFDMDGTLTYPGSINFKRMRERANIPPGVDIFPYVLGQMTGDAQKNAIKVVLEEEELGIQNTVLQDHTNELIQFLNEHDIKVGILTRNSKSVLDRILPMIQGRVDTVISREFQPSKPHPDPIYHFNNCWKTQSNQLMLVGDHIDDIIPAYITDSISCYMNPHYSGREEDKKIELSRCEQVTDYIMEMKKKGDYYYPDFVVQNISELYALLRNNL